MRKFGIIVVLSLLVSVGCDRPAPIEGPREISFSSQYNRSLIEDVEDLQKENVKVLVTLSKDNYPIGFKDTVTDGDWPVVWSNTDYNMIYMNMGHGTRIFVDPTQNYLIYNAMRWLMRDKF